MSNELHVVLRYPSILKHAEVIDGYPARGPMTTPERHHCPCDGEFFPGFTIRELFVPFWLSWWCTGNKSESGPFLIIFFRFFREQISIRRMGSLSRSGGAELLCSGYRSRAVWPGPFEVRDPMTCPWREIGKNALKISERFSMQLGRR